MSEQPRPDGPPREVIAPAHISLRKEVGRPAGPAPLEYGEVRLWLVAKDAHALFAYWEFRPEEHPEAVPKDGAARFFLRILHDGGTIAESTREIEPAAGQCTVDAGHADTPYHAELGFFNEQGVWCFLARSRPARTPPAGIREPKSSPAASPPPSPDPPDAPGQEPPPWKTTDEARLKNILAAEVARNIGQAPAPRPGDAPPSA